MANRLSLSKGEWDERKLQDPKARPRPLELLSAQSFGHLPEEASGIPALLRQHHEAVMRRLDLQDDLLHKVLNGMISPAFAMMPEEDAMREGSPPKKVPQTQTSHASLLTSYTMEDLQHKDDALQAHSQHSRKRFATPTQKARRIDENCLQMVVKHHVFEAFFALVVISNAVFIGIDVQRTVTTGVSRSTDIQVIQYSYTGLFLLELLMRILAFGRKFFVSEEWMWAWLDLFIVTSSLWEVIVDIVQAALEGQGDLESIAGISNMKSFRIIRLTRLLKTAQFIRIFRFVMALRMLVTSIISTLKALLWALVLLALIVYVFAVLFTQAVYEHKNDPAAPAMPLREAEASTRYFGSLAESMLSLFMSIAGGVSWEEVIGPLKEISIVWALCFVFYVAFTYFAVLNVVTGVFCQSAIESAQNDHAMVVQALMDNKAAHIAKLRSLFNHLNGQDNDAGIITLGMFEEKINSPAVREYFEALGLDIWDAWSFFKLLDAAGDGAVDLEDFFDGCLRFRGPARAMDMGRIMQDQRWLIRSQGRFQTFVGRELVSLKSDVTDLLQHLAIKTTANQWAPSQWKAP
ncbi:unnamed protein product [Effrenium voratum]|nr:unnamed protein product [Effrenium voratum]